MSDVFKPPRVARIRFWLSDYDRIGALDDFAAGAPFTIDNRLTGGGNMPPWVIDGWLIDHRELDDGRVYVEMEVTEELARRLDDWRGGYA